MATTVTLFEPADAAADASAGPTVRVRMTVAYDGSGFHGFASNAGVRTVGGVLAEAAALVLGHPVELTCAGRTDRGVHALGQVVTFDAVAPVDLHALTRSLNHLCGPAVAVRDVIVAEPGFDARFSATARCYRYTVLNRSEPDPFRAGTAWHVSQPLDRFAMALACDPFVGEHDFSAFCRRPKRTDRTEASLVRRVTEASWSESDDGVLRFEIEASSFCHQMVRSVVGTMVDVGAGRKKAGDLAGILRSGNRARAGNLAPPHGLALVTVRYDDWSS